MWCLLHHLQVAETDRSSHLRGQREAWLPTTRGLLVGSTCNGCQLRALQKKKGALQLSTVDYCFHSPVNTPTLKLPLPNALGDPQTLGHCPFPRPYN